MCKLPEAVKSLHSSEVLGGGLERNVLYIAELEDVIQNCGNRFSNRAHRRFSEHIDPNGMELC
jgi:hypothetical protein